MSSPSNLAERTHLLQELRAELEASDGRERYCGGQRLVLGEGNPGARLALVGEAPGGQEARRGHPFVGPAGQILDEALVAAGLHRDQLWVTNVVKCRPTTEGVAGRLKNRSPSLEEVDWFLPWLLRELEIVQPRAIACLGATAGNALVGRQVRITRERGMWFEGPDGTPTLVTYHPAYLLRRTSDRDDRYAEFVRDLRSAAGRAGAGSERWS